MCFSPKGDGVHVYFDVFMFCSTRGPRKLMFLKLRFFNGRPPNNAVGGLPFEKNFKYIMGRFLAT